MGRGAKGGAAVKHQPMPTNNTEYRPIPVEAARHIAEQYEKSIVIVLAHDPVHGQLHTTTYGIDAQNKAWAAQGGEIAAKALGAINPAVDFEDYRLRLAKRLLLALRVAINLAGESIEGPGSDVGEIFATVKEAEEYLETVQCQT